MDFTVSLPAQVWLLDWDDYVRSFFFFWLNRLLTHEQPTRTDEETTGKHQGGGERGQGRSRAPRASNARGRRPRRRAQRPSLAVAQKAGRGGGAGTRGRLPGWPPLLKGACGRAWVRGTGGTCCSQHAAWPHRSRGRPRAGNASGTAAHAIAGPVSATVS